ncbi:MAG: hypothetical protein KF819_13295 [Labilithrix sp.]|nr:hypothetical protein [Labilithrix sp.]
MTLGHARARYLSAIGAVLPPLAIAACRDATPPASTIASDPTSTATPSATPSASAAEPPITASATPSASAAEPQRPIPMKFPPCPSGKFCVAEPAKLTGKPAPEPFAKCAVTTNHPDDAADAGSRAANRFVNFSPDDTKMEREKDKTACCYTWGLRCPGGRAFRDATGTPAVARTTARADWTAGLGALAVDRLSPEERASLAAHWTREAAFEHASIASFAQLTLDLMSVGAPPELLSAAQCAAIDEVEHARIAFALAAAYGGEAVGPAPLAASPGAHRTLADIARTTFIDACVGESVASATLADDARKTDDPVLRELLSGMAEDEERHAELAWRIVAWTLRVGGEDVARTVADARDAVVEELVALTHGDAISASDALRATVLREVVLPCAVALVAAQAPPAPPSRARLGFNA